MEPRWLNWARRLQAIAQNGLLFAENGFDVERYQAVQRISAEMLSAGSGGEVKRVLDLFSAEYGYATPKVDVRGVVFREDAILLVKERADNGWTIPGGWAEIGVSPGQNAVKEVSEESGYQTRLVKLLGVYDRNKQPGLTPHPHHIYRLYFLCELTGGAPSTSIETDGAGFFRQDEIPRLSLGRSSPEILARMFELYQHPEWPPDFD